MIISNRDIACSKFQMHLANNHNNCNTIISGSIPFFETGSQSTASTESNTVSENDFVEIYLLNLRRFSTLVSTVFLITSLQLNEQF